MKLKEFEGKQIFAKYDLRLPQSYVARSPEEVVQGLGQIEGDEVVLKAQVLVGGRGKAGGIKICEKAQAQEVAQELFSMQIKGEPVEELLVEEKLQIDQELYISLTINRAEKGITLLFSMEGGVDIEDLADKSPEKIARLSLTSFDRKQIADDIKWLDIREELMIVIESLYNMMKAEDAELVEINPLVLSKGEIIAADSKVIIDDNALYRHKEYADHEEEELTGLEAEARDQDLQYVELDGDIAIIGNGAGLVMASLDVLSHYGGQPANFLDVGGGASVEKMEQALSIVLQKEVKGLFINIFGGITRCDEIAQGLVNFRDEHKITVPMVVRLIGTNEDKGRKILEKNGIPALESMEEGAVEIVKQAKVVAQ